MIAKEGVQAIAEGWRRVVGREPTPTELQAASAISRHETGFSTYKPFGGHNNFGAVQCCKPNADGECPPGSFLHKDSYPTDKGTSVSYAICFKSYPDAVTGASDFVRNITTRRPRTMAALATGDAWQIAAAMYDERYYQGFGATREKRIEGYQKAIIANGEKNARELGEPLLLTLGGDGSPPAPADKPPQTGEGTSGGGSIVTLLIIAALGALAARWRGRGSR